MKYIYILSIFAVSLLACQKQINYSTDISGLSERIANLQRVNDSLAVALSQTNSNINTANLNIANLTKSVDSIKNQLQLINTQIAALTTQLTATNANIASIANQITLLNQQYADLLAKLNDISNRINANNGLVAFYPFTGNAIDSSGNGYNGTVINATLTNDRFGKSNSAYYFNGTSSFIDVTAKFFDNGWENATISVWFNTATNQSVVYGGGQTIVNTNCFNGFALGYSYLANKRIYVYKNSNQTVSWDILKNDVFNFTSVNLNTWYFLTIVKSGLTYTYYINGQLDKTITSSITPLVNNMYPLRIGGVITPLPTDNRELFTGNIDDIRIYNKALTQSDITYLYSH